MQKMQSLVEKCHNKKKNRNIEKEQKESSDVKKCFK